MPKFAEVLQQQRCKPRTGPRMLSLTGPRDLPPAWRFSWEKWSQDIYKRSSQKNATGLPTNVLVPKRSKIVSGMWHTASRNPIIQIIQSVCHMIWDTPQTQLINLPSHLLTEPCKYCMRMHVHSPSQSFCISWNFSSSKSCGFSTASSSQTALDFKGSALVVSIILSQSRIKLDFQETHPPKKKSLRDHSWSYIQEFPLGPCHRSLLSQTCSWRTKGPTVWCEGCSCGGTALCDGMFVIGAKGRGDNSPNSNICIYIMSSFDRSLWIFT